jgi:hypothetical protein
MGRGAFAAVTSLAMAAVVSGSCGGERTRDLAAGMALPAEWLSAGNDARVPVAGAGVVWVFRTADCLSCQSIDYVVRRLTAAHGDSLRVLAIHIGDEAGRSVVDRFITSRRVALDALTTVSPREFSRHFRSTALPALLVVQGDRVEWSSAIPQGVAELTQIDSVVRAVRLRPAGYIHGLSK